MVANFEKSLVSPSFIFNFRKSHQILESWFKSSDGEKTEEGGGGGVHKDPLDRIWLKYFTTFFLPD